ncbi:MAG: transposase [Rikenellaceae bacterium]
MNGDLFEKQYKNILSGYRTWKALGHADKWLVFPENIGDSLCIDEVAMSNGDLYTVLTNRAGRGRNRTIVAIVEGVSAEVVIAAIQRIPHELRLSVKEVTLDMSNSMNKIARTCFPKAQRVIDRFHLQKLACDAVQEIRIKYRWDAIQEDNEARKEAKWLKTKYEPIIFSNGDTKKQLLARSRYLLFKSPDKWSESQKIRAEILFAQYPDLQKAHSLSHSLRMIMSKKVEKDVARLSLAKWYNQVEEAGFHSFNVIAATIYEHYDEILNFFINRATNAFAESFNSIIKAFRTNLRGVTDVKFFLYRLTTIFA